MQTMLSQGMTDNSSPTKTAHFAMSMGGGVLLLHIRERYKENPPFGRVFLHLFLHVNMKLLVVRFIEKMKGASHGGYYNDG